MGSARILLLRKGHLSSARIGDHGAPSERMRQAGLERRSRTWNVSHTAVVATVVGMIVAIVGIVGTMRRVGGWHLGGHTLPGSSGSGHSRERSESPLLSRILLKKSPEIDFVQAG